MKRANVMRPCSAMSRSMVTSGSELLSSFSANPLPRIGWGRLATGRSTLRGRTATVGTIPADRWA